MLVCEPAAVTRMTPVRVLSQPEVSLHPISTHHVNHASRCFELGHVLLLWQLGRRRLNSSHAASARGQDDFSSSPPARGPSLFSSGSVPPPVTSGGRHDVTPSCLCLLSLTPPK